MADDVELSQVGEVATVQLRRPAKGNALRGASFDQLRKIGLKLTDSPPRFVLLCGEGADFCVGLDRDRNDVLFQSLEAAAKSRDAYRTQELVVRLRAAVDWLTRVPCPVIAAIEGRCAGAGAEVALAADLRVFGEGATLTFDDAQHGLVTGLGGIFRTVGALGAPRAIERLLTGRPTTAAEAVSLGLANRMVPTGAALSSALELIQELRRASPVARTQAVVAARGIQSRFASEALDLEAQAAARSWLGVDWNSGR